MTPLDKIRDWLSSIPEEEARKDIAFFVLAFNLEDKSYWTDGIEPVLDQWLTPDKPVAPLLVGRAIAFREAVKFSLSKRFSEDGWDMSAGMFKDVLEEAKRDPASVAASMAKHAQDMLDRLPHRIELWKRIGASWTPFAEAELSDSALREWYEKRLIPGSQ